MHLSIVGSFDHYLGMDVPGPEADTNARIQYKTAMILKKQREEKKRRQVTPNDSTH